MLFTGLVNVPADSTKITQPSFFQPKIDSTQSSFVPCSYTPSLWLKADEGISLANLNVSTWADQSGNNNSADQANTNLRPFFQNNSINFNPAIDFDGSNDYLQGNSGGSNTTLFMVARSDINVSSFTPGQTIFTTQALNPSVDVYFFTLGIITAAFANEVITNGFGSFLEYRKSHTGNTTIPNIPHLYSTNHNQATTAAIYYDGAQIDNSTTNAFINPENDRPYRVGGNLFTYGGANFNGQIAEVLSFPTTIDLNNREIIQSYLGIKYGITLAHAYKKSSGIITWNEPDFPNDIAAIGRDDCFRLNQKQSKNSNTDAILTIGLGTIAADNSSNNNTFNNNQSFLFWGNDNDNNGVVEEIATELPDQIDQRLDREWKIRNIGNVGATTVQFDLNSINHSANSAADLFLLIDMDGDGNFTTGTIQKIAATGFSGSVVEFSNITFSDGVIISLATLPTPNTAPEITESATTISVCPNGQNYDITPTIQVADSNNDDLTAQISISGSSDNADVIAVDLTGFPTAFQSFSYPTLQITGIISPVQMQSILQTLYFSTTSTLTGIRNISLLVNDGTVNSNQFFKNVQSDENLSFCCSADAPLISN